jgi:putative transposase
MKYQKENYKVYSLIYHLIFVVKYRQKIFLDDTGIINDLKEKLVKLAKTFDVELLEIECGIERIY